MDTALLLTVTWARTCVLTVSVPVLQLFPYPLSAFAFVSASAFAVGIAAFADVRGGGSCRPISKAFQERFGLEGGNGWWILTIKAIHAATRVITVVQTQIPQIDLKS